MKTNIHNNQVTARSFKNRPGSAWGQLPTATVRDAATDTPTLPGLDAIVKPFRFPTTTHEYKVVSLRETPTPDSLQTLDTPDKAAAYLRYHLPQIPYFNPEAECFVVILLNTRRKAKGHQLVTIGTHDTLLVHPLAVFRLAVATNSPAIILAHNHPSGDPSPSEADIKVTRDLIRGGQLLKIEILDHIILGNPNRASLRELGYFYQ